MKKVSFSKDTRHLNRNVICQRYGKKKKKDLMDWTQQRTVLVLKSRSIKSFLQDTKRKKRKSK